MKQKSKKRDLFSNIIYFFICTILVRIVSYILLPICTKYLSTTEYGRADLVISTVNFVYPLVALGVSGSVLRLGMDEEYNKSKLLSVAQGILLITNGLVFAVIPFSELFGNYAKYIYIIPLMVLFCNELNLLNEYCKSIDNTKVIVLGSGINAVVKITASVFFVKYLKLGAEGVLWGYMIASFINVFFLMWKSGAVSSFTRNISREERKKYRHDILSYGIPLIPNSLAWWILQLSDRYMVAYFIGAAANGLYSVAYKIPSILNAVISIFSQAWQLSVIKESSDKGSLSYYNQIYRYYSAVCYGGTALIILLTKVLAKLMFQNDFFAAWYYVPVLMFAAVCKCQEEFFGPFYMAGKQTKKYFVSSISGAGLNIVLNAFMIPAWGIMGASIATVISYFLTYVIRVAYAKKQFGVEIYARRTCISMVLLLIQVLAWALLMSDGIIIVVNVMVLLGLIIVYRKEMNEIWTMSIIILKKIRLTVQHK